MRRRLKWTLAVPLTLLLIAATSACGDDEAAVASPFQDCSTLTAPPSAAPSAAALPAAAPSASAAVGGSGATVVDLPDLELSCFTGGDKIALRDVRGPAVINIWASWCLPCRTELPVMQALADKAAGRVTVVGVDSKDDRGKGAEFAGDKDVRMPTLFDEDGKLLNGLGRINLPVTVFLDAAGRAYVHPLPLDASGLSEQLRKYTGVAVAP
ncbi:TlpA family protein disulfide reductase [Actinoplanes solisilvae]|uniref:TlpA family protein disulfide reductase n=1 Tax=Actinoplanes solisilvae TaxID=2486853 RepID=UPI001F0CB0AD|nr:TlpA disulfide reductase family protein [Actinoplanes solisilvae]